MAGGIKNQTNSFTLNIKNNNYDVQPLSLFQLGASGNAVPLGLGGSGGNQQTFNVNQPTPDAINPTFVATDYFTYSGGTPDGTNIFWTEGGDISIRLSNGVACTLSVGGLAGVPPNATLNTLNFEFNNPDGYIGTTPITDFSIAFTMVAIIEGGALTGIQFLSTHEGVFVDEVEFTNLSSGAITLDLQQGNAEQTAGTSTPNNVFVSPPTTASSLPTYTDINQLQNGSVFDIISMSIETKAVSDGNGGIIDNQAPQLLQPISFSNVDVNGNDQTKAVVPTIDPNQVQQVLGDIQLGDADNGVNYQLDGETSLDMNLEGLANINLTLNYVPLPNLVAGTEFGIQQAMEEQAQLTQEAQDNDYKRNIKLSKASIKALKKDVKKKKLYLLLHEKDLPSFQTMCGYSLEYSLLPMY